MLFASMFVADDPQPRPGYSLAWLAMFGIAVGAFVVLVGLRNVGLWLLGLTGTRADGVVDRIEISNGPLDAARRPVISFTARDGRPFTARPAVYRKRCRLTAGERVRISYLGRNPGRIVIHGYDFRLREPATSIAGLLVSTASLWWYLHL